MIGMPRGLVTAAISSSRTLARCSCLPSSTTSATGSLQRRVEIGAGVDLDDLAAEHAHRLVVGEALVRRDDDAVDHALGERQAQHLHRVVAGDAGRRCRAPPRRRCRR